MMGRRVLAILSVLLFLLVFPSSQAHIDPYSGLQECFVGGYLELDVALSPGTANNSATVTLPPYCVVRNATLDVSGVETGAGQPSNLTMRLGSREVLWGFVPGLNRVSSFSDGSSSKSYTLAAGGKGVADIVLPRNASSLDLSMTLAGEPGSLGAGTVTNYQMAGPPAIADDRVNVHAFSRLTNQLFVGTQGGLTVLNLTTGSRSDFSDTGTSWHKLPGRNVRDLFFIEERALLLVGTNGGAAVINLAASTTSQYTTATMPALPSNNVEGVGYDSLRSMALIAMNGAGLALINLSSSAMTVYNSLSTPAVPDDGICILACPSRGRIFYGSDTNGVAILDISQNPVTVARYTTASSPSLVTNVVRQVDYCASSNTMYVASHGGVTVINLTSKDKSTLTDTTTPALAGVLLESLYYDQGSNTLFIATGSSGTNGKGVQVVNMTSKQMTTYNALSTPALLGDNARYVSYDAAMMSLFVSMTSTGGATKGGLTRIDLATWPSNVSVDIGNDGSAEWARIGPLSAPMSVGNLSAAAQARLASAAPSRDTYGNELVTVPVAVSTAQAGTLTLRGVDATYSLTLHVNGLAAAMNGFIGNLAAGANITIPINITSATAGTLRLSNLSIGYDVVPPPNQAPLIKSTPPVSAIADTQYLYQLIIEDPDGDATAYALAKGPAGANLSTSGLLSWTPTKADAGKHDFSVNVTDGMATSRHNWSVNVSSVAGNNPPVITSYPITAAVVGVEYRYTVTATDANVGDSLTFSLDIAPDGMVINSASGLITWVSAIADAGTWQVRINVTDSKDYTLQSYNLTVIQAGMNNLPQISSFPPTKATVGVSYTYQIRATDMDGDPLTYALRMAPTGMNVDPSGKVYWTPSTDQMGETCVLLHVMDGKGYTAQSFSVVVLAINHLPVVTTTPDKKVRAGHEYTYEINATDVDTGDVLTFSIENPPPGMTLNNTTLRWKPKSEDRGTYFVKINISDGRDFVLHEYYLTITAPAVKPTGSDMGPAYAAVAVMLAVIIGLSYFILVRKRKAAPVAAVCHPDFSMEDIFMIYNDGRLMRHTTRRIKHEMDKHILTSMLTAIQNFVEVGLSREEKAPLGSMEYGRNKIMFERGKYCVIAVVISGGEPPELRGLMKQTMSNIESEFAVTLENWDGDAKKVEGVDRFMTQLSEYRPDAPKPEKMLSEAEINVKLMAEVEFFQGFVRLKVAVKNDADSVITDVSAKMVFNEEVLKLYKIEPSYQMMGREVQLGNIGRKEKKTVAYYLDPQICTESYVDGALSFRDHKGELRHLSMKRKMVSVVCPILSTDENVNVAMLKRMLKDTLDKQDRKLFRIPDGIDARKAFQLSKSAVQGHDMRLVREYIRDLPSVQPGDKPTLDSEVWYCASVKGREDKLVVRLGISERDRTVEFFAASTSLLVVTGILAELKSDLNSELKNAGAAGVELLPGPEAGEGAPLPDALSGSQLEMDEGANDHPSPPSPSV